MGLNTELPKITIILLNYKRPQNIPIILESIKSQTVKAAIFLWNNGKENVNSPLIDRYEQSSKNVGCMVRWKLAKEATTPYVMSLDDDLCFSRNDVLENIIQSLEKQDNPNRIIGLTGLCLKPIPVYSIRKEFTCQYSNENYQIRNNNLIYEIGPGGSVTYIKIFSVDKDKAVDIVKGRALAFRKQLLDSISLPEEREDDIFLSASFANKARKFHRISALLNNAFYELPERGAGNRLQQGHYLSRDRAFRAYFSPNVILGNRFSRYILVRVYMLIILALRMFSLLKRHVLRVFVGF